MEYSSQEHMAITRGSEVTRRGFMRLLLLNFFADPLWYSRSRFHFHFHFHTTCLDPCILLLSMIPAHSLQEGTKVTSGAKGCHVDQSHAACSAMPRLSRVDEG
jgi:hypothetical protein